MQTIHTSRPTEPSSSKVLKIVGIVVIIGVVLCGLLGSCLLVLTFLLPYVAE